MCVWDSYVYQKGVLCFIIHKSYVGSIKSYWFFRKYAVIIVVVVVVVVVVVLGNTWLSDTFLLAETKTLDGTKLAAGLQAGTGDAYRSAAV